MSWRLDRGRHLWLAVTERPALHHSSPTPSCPRLGSSPSISATGFQVQPQASLLSVKMSPGSRGLFLFIFRFVPLWPSLCGAAPVLRTGPQNVILLQLPFPSPPGKAQRRPAAEDDTS